MTPALVIAACLALSEPAGPAMPPVEAVQGARVEPDQATAPIEPPPAAQEPAKPVEPRPPSPGTTTAAVGAGGQTPLPPAPPPEDPKTISDHPWRGRFEMMFRAGALGSVGGERPARGTLVSAYGGIGFAARVHSILAVGVAVSTFIHDSEQESVTDIETGEPTTAQGLGRVTLFDVGARALWPAARRVEPYVEVDGSVGVRRAPLTGSPTFVGGVRLGTGVDFWLGPTFTIGVGLSYRALFVANTAGHGLQGGARFAVHW